MNNTQPFLNNNGKPTIDFLTFKTEIFDLVARTFPKGTESIVIKIRGTEIKVDTEYHGFL